MNNALKERQLPLLPPKVERPAKARLREEYGKGDWQSNFLSYLDLIEQRHGKRALIIELHLRLGQLEQYPYEEGSPADEFITRMMDVLEESKFGDQIANISDWDLRQLKRAIIEIQSRRKPLFPSRRWIPEHERPTPEREASLGRWLYRLGETSDVDLLRTLVCRLGSCDMTEFEIKFLIGNYRKLTKAQKWQAPFVWTDFQRQFAERLLIGHHEKPPLVGLIRRPKVFRRDLIERFKTETRFVRGPAPGGQRDLFDP